MIENRGRRLDVRRVRRDAIARGVEVALLALIGTVGVLMAHHPMLLSGFRRMQTDLGDSRFIHYMLEHGYLWVLRVRGHESLWSPPIFYPVSNAGAYSDLFLGVGPVYWLWRLLGAPVDLSFGLWMISMSVLNYLAGLLLFRRGFRFGLAASAGAAALVAFGAPRVNQMCHQQLLPCFYVLVAAYCLARLAQPESTDWRVRAGYWLIAVLSVVAQLYSGVYVGWFFVMTMVLTAAAALGLPGCRERLVWIVWRDAWAIVAAGAVGFLLLRPFLDHYGRTAAELKGTAYMAGIFRLQPQMGSWFSMGERNWLWGWTAYREPFRSLNFGSELYLGIGMLTLPICCVGLLIRRNWPICQLGAAVMIAAWFGTTRVPGSHLSVVALVLSLYCGAGLLRESDAGRYQARAVIVVLLVGFLCRFPSEYLQVVILSGIVFGLLRLQRPDGAAGVVLAIAMLSLVLFPVALIVYGIALAIVVWLPLAYLFRGRRREIGVAFGWLVLALLVYTNLGDRPRVVIWAAVGVPVSLGLTSPKRLRPPVWLLSSTILVAVPFLSLFYNTDSLWIRSFYWIPGGMAIRVLARVVLILLIPAAVGLACVIEILERNRWRIAAWSVVLLCLAEQLVTTESFDVAEHRGRVETVARRVDTGRDAFFYYRVAEGAAINDQLDAMWASLLTGVPTVNGYSGYHPPSWSGFTQIGTEEGLTLAATVQQWEEAQGLEAGSVQLIEDVEERGGSGRVDLE